jgi:hypothetical protein
MQTLSPVILPADAIYNVRSHCHGEISARLCRTGGPLQILACLASLTTDKLIPSSSTVPAFHAARCPVIQAQKLVWDDLHAWSKWLKVFLGGKSQCQDECSLSYLD